MTKIIRYIQGLCGGANIGVFIMHPNPVSAIMFLFITLMVFVKGIED